MKDSAEKANQELMQSLGITSAAVFGVNDNKSKGLKNSLAKLLSTAIIGISAAGASITASASDFDKPEPSRFDMAKDTASEVAFNKKYRLGAVADFILNPQSAVVVKGLSALTGGVVAASTADQKIAKRAASIVGTAAMIATAGPVLAGIETVSQAVHIYEDVKAYQESKSKERLRESLQDRQMKRDIEKRMEEKIANAAFESYLNERELTRALPEADREFRYGLKLRLALEGYYSDGMPEHLHDALKYEERIESEGGEVEPWVKAFRERIYSDFNDDVDSGPEQASAPNVKQESQASLRVAQLNAGMQALASWKPASPEPAPSSPKATMKLG